MAKLGERSNFIILTVKKYINMKIIFKETKLVLQNNGNLYLSLTALIFLLAYVMQLISCYTLISSLLCLQLKSRLPNFFKFFLFLDLQPN